MKAIDLLILEDDPILVQTLQILFSGEPSFSQVKSATTGKEALKILEDFRPDVVLVDLGLPDMDGADFIRVAKGLYPDAEFLAYTVYDEIDTVLSALKAGATGYVLKGCTPSELIESVLKLYEGGVPMSAKVARALIKEFQGDISRRGTGESLTDREMNVLQALERGLSYKEIASQLKVSYHTIHTHIKRIYEKLQAHGRREALRKAKMKGLL